MIKTSIILKITKLEVLAHHNASWLSRNASAALPPALYLAPMQQTQAEAYFLKLLLCECVHVCMVVSGVCKCACV
jgi:hypothetical protein